MRFSVCDLVVVVLIHWDLIPSGELIRSEQKNHTKSLPSLDFLQVWLVQLSAEALSVMLRRSGCSLSVMFFIVNTCRDAQ
jgi:hypothetical protein